MFSAYKKVYSFSCESAFYVLNIDFSKLIDDSINFVCCLSFLHFHISVEQKNIQNDMGLAEVKCVLYLKGYN